MRTLSILVSYILLAFTATVLSAQVSILQNRYDDFGTSANLRETVLKPSDVNVRRFGKLWSYAVDGSVYAQPLYVPSLSIAGGVHNVLYVATMNDKLYAFDADHPGSPLWLRDFTDAAAGVTPVPIVDIAHSNYLNIVGNVGILSTPVIDRARGTLYVLARTKERGHYVQRLHAIDIATGRDKLNPAVIQASIPSTARDAVNGILRFDPKGGNQRAALALARGAVILAWASHEDTRPYHGWIMAYDETTLKQISALCLSPNGGEGGIWQSGRAPVIDREGNIYFETGNGSWDGRREFGDSVIRLTLSGNRLRIVDYFTPDNYQALDKQDGDLGSTGPLLIPGTGILVCGDKLGQLFLLKKGRLGHEHPGNPGLIERLSINGGPIMGGTAYWHAPEGPLVYLWSQADFLKAFRFNGRRLDRVPYAKGDVASTGSPGGALTISADGRKAGTGVLWAMLTTRGSADNGNKPGILRAYNAETLTELWNSEQDPARDRLGTLVKFVPPVVVNGKVYAVTYDNAIRVYGLLPPNEQGAPAAPRAVVAPNPSSITPRSHVERGRREFQRCAACHEGGNGNRRMGPRLEGLFQAKKLLNGRPVTDESVRDFILHGGNGMPAYQTVLTPDEISDILVFLHTLQDAKQPAP